MIICDNCTRTEFYDEQSKNNRTIVKPHRADQRYCARHRRHSPRGQTRRGDGDLRF